MENETPKFFEDRDILGLEKPKIPVNKTENSQSHDWSEKNPNANNEPKDETGQPYEDASNTLRFINYLIDCVGVLVFGVVIGVIFGTVGMAHLITGTNENFLGLILMLFYYGLMEGIMGRTLGKFVTGTKVITTEGNDPTFMNILGRTLCRFIPFDAFSFLGGGPGGWHDTISHTRVVKVK
ncbi:MAG TPA: RDD family protein [Bacteroidia bacterium]|jgi:uncharacterized RDD family membrane protein YckC|nr:RDD family protein [Bacteroidia bacterium]